MNSIPRIVAELGKSTLVMRAIFSLFLLVIVKKAIDMTFPHLTGQSLVMVDYHSFYVSGRLVLEGRIDTAYHVMQLMQAQYRILNVDAFMPWTYPLHFNVFVAGLAMMPTWLGYVLFMSLTLLFYLWSLRLLARDYFILLVIATFPMVLTCVNTGQNGLLLGGLAATFARLMMHHHTRAGVPLAFMSIKPHFLPLLGIYLLLRKQWSTILIASLLTLAMLAVATMMMGVDVWHHFLSAMQEAKYFLSTGAYPLFRMTSAYACIYTLTQNATYALLGHITLALMWCAALVMAHRRQWSVRHILALMFMGTIFLSPYTYDYDIPILGVSIALMIKDILAKARSRELATLFLLLWFGGFVSMVLHAREELYGATFVTLDETAALSEATQLLPSRERHVPSLGILGLLPFCLLSLRIVRREGGKE